MCLLAVQLAVVKYRGVLRLQVQFRGGASVKNVSGEWRRNGHQNWSWAETSSAGLYGHHDRGEETEEDIDGGS